MIVFLYEGTFCMMNNYRSSNTYTDYLFADRNQHLYHSVSHKPIFFKKMIQSNETIQFLKHFYPHNYKMQKNILKNFTKNYSNNMNLHVLLEFYHMEGDFDEIALMIKQMKKTNNSTNQAWASLYDLMLQYRLNQTSPQEIINILLETPTSTHEMKLFSLIIHLLSVFRLSLYDSFNKVSKHVLPLLDSIDNDYLRNSYKFQLMQIYATAKLYKNNIETSRLLCTQMLDKNLNIYYPTVYSDIYHTLATSYICTNFDTCIYWLNKASSSLFSLSTAYSYKKIKNIQKTLYFAENFWRKNLNYLPSDRTEAAHRLIVTNQKKEALTLLHQILIQKGYFTPLQEYYYGIASNDYSKILSAKEKFLWESNSFYLQLFSEETLNQYGIIGTSGKMFT